MIIVENSLFKFNKIQKTRKNYRLSFNLNVCRLISREFDSCLQFFTNQIAQNVDYINAFEFFYCQICENNCTNMG